MAISKSIVSPTGAVAAHWVVTEAAINLLTRTVDCTMRGWLDQGAFEAGYQPVDVRRFRFGPAELDATGVEVPITELLTAMILATPEFAAAPPAPEPAPDPEAGDAGPAEEPAPT